MSGKCSLVPVTKPVIQFGSNDSILHTGMNLTLTCLARGSPPFTYRWLKIVPGDAASLVGQDATLRFEKLELFDAGKYYCEVKNRISTLQRSNTVQLTVEGEASMWFLFGNLVKWKENPFKESQEIIFKRVCITWCKVSHPNVGPPSISDPL